MEGTIKLNGFVGTVALQSTPVASLLPSFLSFFLSGTLNHQFESAGSQFPFGTERSKDDRRTATALTDGAAAAAIADLHTLKGLWLSVRIGSSTYSPPTLPSR